MWGAGHKTLFEKLASVYLDEDPRSPDYDALEARKQRARSKLKTKLNDPSKPEPKGENPDTPRI